MNIALIDYEAGNIHSAHKALEVAARQCERSNMATFSVFVPPEIAVNFNEHIHVERPYLVKHGFSAIAFVFGPIWLIAEELWRDIFIYILIAFSLAVVTLVLDARVETWVALMIPLHLWLGFRAKSLVRNRLAGLNYAFAGVYKANDRDALIKSLPIVWRVKAPQLLSIESDAHLLASNLFSLILNFRDPS
ncbi:MAG: DUF2628 domain-containing protein [Beijerinckiaceae bacterium]|nr:DUF2628 domain-containing protein [Beijerinckiaceae bacterium]